MRNSDRLRVGLLLGFLEEVGHVEQGEVAEVLDAGLHFLGWLILDNELLLDPHVLILHLSYHDCQFKKYL